MKSYLDIYILAVLHFTADLVKTYKNYKACFSFKCDSLFQYTAESGGGCELPGL